MRDRLTRLTCVTLAVATGLALLAPVFDMRTLLGGGDVTAFHLPLRTVFRQLALAGEPFWNPLINGGQPILSNPNYAAFYPLTWLLLPFEPATALHLTVLLHLLWAGVGAWRLARHFGCGPSAAAIATLGFTCGPLIGVAQSMNIVCSLSWFPWIVLWADRAFEGARPGRSWRRPAILASLGLALQLFAGDPTPLLLTSLALGALALLRRPRNWRRTVPRLAVIGVLAGALAAVQLAPTMLRAAESVRAGGGIVGREAVWSLPPVRAVEWLQPHAFGTLGYKPGFYFAGGIHDRLSAYVPRLTFGLLPFLLALAAALRWPVARRGAWAACAVAGFVLALGRHNVVAGFLINYVPPFSLVRFPEKYVLLTTTALAFLGAVGWQHLLERRRVGRADEADFPATLALVAAGVLAAGLAALILVPERLTWLLKPHPELEVPAAYVRERLAYLRWETGVAIAVAVAAAALLFAFRARRLSARFLAVGAVALLAFDLFWFGRGLIVTEPRRDLLAPPPILDELAVRHGRVYGVTDEAGGLPFLPIPRGEYLSMSRWRIHHLGPYHANLFGIGYVANVDFDAMATRWGLWQLEIADRLRRGEDADGVYKLLGAWNVPNVVLPHTPEQLLEDLKSGADEVRYADAIRNPYVLPRYRPVPRVTFHPGAEAALTAAIREGLRFPESDHWIGAPPADRPPELAPVREFVPLALDERASHVEARYRAPRPAAFVAAVTFHQGWTARVDGEVVPTYPTALGQIGVLLPAGEHTLELRFFERPVLWGGLVTLAALLLCSVAWIRTRRPAGDDPVDPEVASGPVPDVGSPPVGDAGGWGASGVGSGPTLPPASGTGPDATSGGKRMVEIVARCATA